MKQPDAEIIRLDYEVEIQKDGRWKRSGLPRAYQAAKAAMQSWLRVGTPARLHPVPPKEYRQ